MEKIRCAVCCAIIIKGGVHINLKKNDRLEPLSGVCYTPSMVFDYMSQGHVIMPASYMSQGHVIMPAMGFISEWADTVQEGTTVCANHVRVDDVHRF